MVETEGKPVIRLLKFEIAFTGQLRVCKDDVGLAQHHMQQKL